MLLPVTNQRPAFPIFENLWTKNENRADMAPLTFAIDVKNQRTGVHKGGVPYFWPKANQ